MFRSRVQIGIFLGRLKDFLRPTSKIKLVFAAQTGAKVDHQTLMTTIRQLFLTLVLLGCGTLSVSAQGTTIGPTGLKLPRFVSLKSDRVNVRGGPSTDHKVKWIFRRAGLPVEIIQEFENWRRIRDSEGEEGWVYHTLLSGRRTALVSPWQKPGTLVDLRKDADQESGLAIQAQIGVQVDIETCAKNWCKVAAGDHGGWIKANLLWGVYPDEAIQ